MISAETVKIRNAIDKIYTDYPFYGSRRIKKELEDLGIYLCRDQVRHHMRAMAIVTIYPKKNPNLSLRNENHKLYPYLLKGLQIVRVNQVWGTDITYIRIKDSFCYLVAIIDWYSRYIINWTLSESLEIEFCLKNIDKALMLGKPEIHNSDQGSHFTSERYTKKLIDQDIFISMDGVGRCIDNIFTERFWRTIKYENIYIKNYENFDEARSGINEYIYFYNNQRKHSSLDWKTPKDLFFENQISLDEKIIKNVKKIAIEYGDSYTQKTV